MAEPESRGAPDDSSGCADLSGDHCELKVRDWRHPN